MKDKDRQEVADIVTQSLIRAGIVKPPKVRMIPQMQPEPAMQKKSSLKKLFQPEQTNESEHPLGHRIKKFFGKKKPPSYSQLKFNDFMKNECKKGCYLCDSCEDKIREIVKNAIEKDE
jgi:hypothetical protein